MNDDSRHGLQQDTRRSALGKLGIAAGLFVAALSSNAAETAADAAVAPMATEHWVTTGGIAAFIVTVAGFGANVGMAAILGAGCSTPAAHLPLTRAGDAHSNGDGVGEREAADQQPTLGPLDRGLTPDVLVRLPAPLDANAERQLTGLVPAGHSVTLRAGPAPIAAPSGSGTVNTVGVDPAAFRRFTPKNTAEVTGVWDNVARGSLAVSYEASKRLGIPLGGKVTDQRVPHFGAASLAKYAVARRRISFSCSSRRVRSLGSRAAGSSSSASRWAPRRRS